MSYGNAIEICYHLQFYTMIPHITIDNFFETPGLVRDFALRQEYFKGDRGTWPGLRTKFLHELDNELFHIVCGKLMKHMPREFNDFKEIQIGFQLIDESIHFDKTWGPKHPLAGQPIVLRDYQVQTIPRLKSGISAVYLSPVVFPYRLHHRQV